ncbi:DUF1501 domain-containing protein [Sphingomonas sp. MMS24-JH45]
MLGNEHAIVSKRALDSYQQVASALAGAPEANFPLFPANNALADQLKMVARTIAAAPTLGVRRQVFFVSMGGFDHHSNLAAGNAAMIGAVADAMRAFYDTTAAMGVQDQVTTFAGWISAAP